MMAGDDRIPSDFKPTYDREILPHLIAFEEKRVAALHSLRERILIGTPKIVAMVIVCVFLLSQFKGTFVVDLLVTMAVLACFAIVVQMYDRVTLYHREVKQQIFPTVFAHFGDFTYTPDARFSMDDWQPTGIFPTITSANFEDKVSGHYRDVPLEIVEAKLTKGSGKSERTFFKGLIVTLALPKRFTGTTVIHRDKGKVGNLLGTRKFNPVRLESPDFESRYEVYSTDQVEARYLISTTFMERLMALEDKLGCTLEAVFYKRELLIMLASDRKWFEPSSIYEPATFAKDIGLIFDQMQQLFAIIDVLKLDDRTGL
ncbi:MAG: DUF3137 domain-containing protein [Rickettsiales bacterium]|nr:DUF3137 domain-containing protein [Rickettsiales bacterium]